MLTQKYTYFRVVWMHVNSNSCNSVKIRQLHSYCAFPPAVSKHLWWPHAVYMSLFLKSNCLSTKVKHVILGTLKNDNRSLYRFVTKKLPHTPTAGETEGLKTASCSFDECFLRRISVASLFSDLPQLELHPERSGHSTDCPVALSKCLYLNTTLDSCCTSAMEKTCNAKLFKD